MTLHTPRRGRLQEWRARWFGEADPVAEQLADIGRQGTGMAHLAHACAFLLLLLFSLGSLIALGGDALSRVLVEWQSSGQVDIPAAISLAVSGLLVAAMDTAALYAALVIRLLSTRRATMRDAWIHVAVLVTACLLESSTYVYMASQYDKPSNVAAWALIVARAVAAPLFSVYLSLARPLPVTSRDILAQVELASGQGLIRDAVSIANDASAELGEKVALFAASADMTPADRIRLDAVMRAVEMRGIPIYVGTNTPTDIPRLPTGGGTPAAVVNGTTDESSEGGPDSPFDSTRQAVANGHVVQLPQRVTRRVVGSRRKSAKGVRTVDSYERQARKAWHGGAQSVSKMQAAVPGMSRSAAMSWVRTFKAESSQSEGQVAL